MNKNNWLEQYAQLHQNQNNILSNAQIYQSSGISDGFSEHFSSIAPIAQRICAKTLGMDLVAVKPMSDPKTGWTRKSKEQQLREDRLNKLRKIEGKKPNVVLSDDITENELFYLDYQYGNPSGNTQNNI